MIIRKIPMQFLLVYLHYVCCDFGQLPLLLRFCLVAARRALSPPHLSLQLSLPHSHVPSRKGLVSRFEVAGLHPCSFPFAVKSALNLFAWLLWREATKTISRNS